MRLPTPRGPVTAMLVDELTARPHDLPTPLFADEGDALYDEDLQLTLFVCYELHYRGFDDVDDGWEWHPALLGLRAAAEERFERRLRTLIPPQRPTGDVPGGLARLVEADDGPSLAKYLQREATPEQFREFVTHRSIYHLKEADPHTWAIPRVGGAAKAALVEIQADEYGGGRAERMHSELFRRTMRGLGLDDAYGAYLEDVPAITLAVSNLMSFFGLHRRNVGALLGHLAAFEMTSSLPNRRYAAGLARLGADRDTRRFYDEHVQADAVHEQLAAHDMCGGLVAERPELAADVLFGAACCLALDRLFAEHLLDRWHASACSLRAGEPVAAR
jgi:Iron-containing redox enzyme